MTFDLVYPAGYGLSRVPIGAGNGVILGLNDRVLSINGSPGTVTNVGSGLVTVGSGTSTGNIVSAGNVVLLPLGVAATSVQSAGTVNVGLGDQVGSVAQHATLTPLTHRTITVPQLPGTPAEVLAAPGRTTLTPGLYDNVNILPGATVTLTAGNYVINNFVLSALSTLKLDTSQGAVKLFVMNTALWNGQVTGDGTQFVFSYLGILPLTFAGTFTGTALAPNAIINLGPLPASYSGNFYGQQVVVAGGVTVQEIATPLLIASLTVSTKTLCTGQQTEVTVDANDAGTGARVGVNGVPGAHQFVEFPGKSGSRVVYASVVTPNGQADFASVPVTVQSCTPAAGALPPVVLHFWPDPTGPNRVEFMVHDYDANGKEVLPTGSATYAWTFGDGQTATTSSPIASHDYTASANPMLAYNYFQASVTVTASGGSTSAKKIVPIFSVYADNRSRGIVQPPSTATPSGNNLAVNVTNYETTPLSITGARVDLLPCDPSTGPVQQPVTSLSVSLAASTMSTVSVPQPQAFSADICAMGIHLFGTAAAGVVYSDSYALLRENTLIQQAVTDTASVAVLNQASNYTADPNNFNFDALRQLYAQGILTQLPAAVPAGSTYAGNCTATEIGCTCQPGQPAPSAVALTCQPTANWVETPGAAINAFKGDFIIHHACGDMIADLLKTLQQEYSHSMTVSKSQVEIRHSTASENRMIDTVNSSLFGGVVGGPSDPIDPNTLQFGFPGTAGTTAYSVDQMVNGYCAPAPSGDTNSDCSTLGVPGWNVSGSLHTDPQRCTSDVNIVYPLVLRPPPDANPTQLAAVTPVGDQASDIKGHYRFYMYSRADQHSTATSGPSWAVGTQESVCSLFDLESTLHASASAGPLPLQGPLGRTLSPAPGLGSNVPDGMVFYSTSQRSAAGWELFSNLYNMVEGQVGEWAGLVNGLTGGSLDELADSVGNQVVNCFSSDACSDSSNAWHNVGPGIAASPDDIRRTWVTPAHGGTYGYSEPLIYAPTYFRHQYQWVATTGSAQVTVNVVDGSSNPVPNATVVVDGTPAGTTDSAGSLVLNNVNPGSHDLQAEKFLGDGGIVSAPPTPLTETAMEALPACSSSSSAYGSPTCSVIGGAPGSGNAGPSCPFDLQSEECLPHNSTGGNHLGYSEICACFPPPTPQLSCSVELTADHLVTVPSGGSVSFLLTLCTTCSSGVPNSSCTQLCNTNEDCAGTQTCNGSGMCAAVPAIDVAIQNTQEGPVICVKASGFDPAMSLATLTYSNVPGVPASQQPVETASGVQILPDGTVSDYADGAWVGSLPSIVSCPGDVTITLTDQVSGQTASFTEPADYWCANSDAKPTFTGDFCCTDPSLPIQPCP